MHMIFTSKKSLFIVFLGIISVLGANAQTLKGRIISTKGGNAVEFANVIVKATSTGAASDEKGQFTITIPQGVGAEYINVTAVGFQQKTVKISDLSDKKVNLIAIAPTEYNIDEIDVQAESKILFGVIKKCTQNIPQNYIMKPYSSQFNYTMNKQKGEGIISDATGYKRTTSKGAVRRVCYDFYEEDAATTNAPYLGGSTNMDDLLSYDLMRTSGNIMDNENVYHYDLEYIENPTAPSLWVIHFEAKNTDIHVTGDAHATSYEGELYIDKKSFAVSKIAIRGTSAKRSAHGKSVIVGENTSNYVTDVEYETTVTYGIVNGEYQLKGIEMAESFINKEGKNITELSALTITKQLTEYTEIKTRDFFVKKL